MKVSVLIASFGDYRWYDLAWSRAHPSAAVADADEIILHYEPEGTLASVRNGLADEASGDWLCFLDADDELAPGYIDAMTRAIAAIGYREMFLLTPMVEYVGAGGRVQKPMFHREVRPEDGNWLVIGTVIPRALFLEVGGFEEWPKYEDWALFARLQKAGAVPVKVPDAVYRAHRNPRGRNHEGGRSAALAAHDQIRRAVFPELYEQVRA